MAASEAEQALLVDVFNGRYVEVLVNEVTKPVVSAFIRNTLGDTAQAGNGISNVNVRGDETAAGRPRASEMTIFAVGLAAFNAFLQANVTGPVLESPHQVEALFDAECKELRDSNGASNGTPHGAAFTTGSSGLRKACLASLDVDGVSAYPYIPYLELFCLARWIFTSTPSSYRLPSMAGHVQSEAMDPAYRHAGWLRLRIHVWHHKLLAQPSLGSGSTFTKSAQWNDLPSLQEIIEADLAELDGEVLLAGDTPGSTWDKPARLQFLAEKAIIAVMLSLDGKAKEALASVSDLSQFSYALSGALGRRTKFQDKATSQLLVLAKSAPETATAAPTKPVPEALLLNDDTLLESVNFSKENASYLQEDAIELPEALRGLSPDDQPQLSPIDQIILLTEATLKDAFSPADSLTSEEILPYAVRVIEDKPANWQIYTQALLARSRIEIHRSRTVERGVLQMQAIVDQIIVDTASETSAGGPRSVVDRQGLTSTAPVIEITGPDSTIGKQQPKQERDKPTSIFPATRSAESAPPQVRLRYVHALSTPPRWHLESELAYAWAGVGSLVSALEIFKRLRLWAEVALCLASSALSDDDGGGSRGSGEEKAKAVLRWRLFQPVGTRLSAAPITYNVGSDDEDVDITDLQASLFTGPERTPPPPNAPRLFCILGDIESDPVHYERAWELSKHRYYRAQRSLGEYYLKQRSWVQARDAYRKAVEVNRLSPEMWSRLGDINLRLGAFADAAEAFGRAIGASGDVVGGEDARTWSNLGSALYSLYIEAVDGTARDAAKGSEDKSPRGYDERRGEEDTAKREESTAGEQGEGMRRDPATLLSQSLAAYKRGASIARDNWRIWDNVMTLAARVRPPIINDVILALRKIISIRSVEGAIDEDIIRLLLSESVLSRPKPADGIPPRGSEEKAVCDLLEQDVVPLITQRSELWEIVSRERVWRGDLAGAVDAAEKAWRAALGGASSGSLGSTAAAADDKGNWLVDKEAWNIVVARTDELVSLLENYGPDVRNIGPKWKGKARSALRSVMSRGKDSWEGSEGWITLEGLLEGLR